MSDVSVVSLPEHIKALSSNEPETPRIETPLELNPLGPKIFLEIFLHVALLLI